MVARSWRLLIYDCRISPIDYGHDLDLKQPLQACVFEYWPSSQGCLERLWKLWIKGISWWEPFTGVEGLEGFICFWCPGKEWCDQPQALATMDQDVLATTLSLLS